MILTTPAKSLNSTVENISQWLLLRFKVDVRDISIFHEHLILALITAQIKLFLHNLKFNQQIWAKVSSA